MSSLRQEVIIGFLSRHAGGSRQERALAVKALNERGYTDTEITKALQAETIRMREETRRINGLRQALQQEVRGL